MALLGLFGKKSKATTQTQGGSAVYPNADASPTSSKLRIPFSKKAKSDYAPSIVDVPPPRPPFASSNRDSTGSMPHTLEPPSRSAMFGDPQSAMSTRSLPEGKQSPQPPKKSSSFFAWYSSKHASHTEGKKSKLAPNHDPHDPQGSFNLKSFRHVNGPSVLDDLPPPRPRPRGGSAASDSSQRISVAAFREAQAKRSQTGSPVPSLHDADRSFPPFPHSSSSHIASSNSRPSSVATQSQSHPPSALRNRPSRMMLADSSSEEDSEEEDNSDDHHNPSSKRLSRNRTLTQRTASESHVPKARVTKSDLGHGTPSPRAATSSFRPPVPSPTHPIPSSNSTPANSPSAKVYGGDANLRRRASKSTSAVPSSTSTQTKPSPKPAPAKVPPRRTQLVSDSDSDDSDDAPLASLVPPKRPGSAASSHSLPTTRSASPFGSRSNLGHGAPAHKPLIDINTLTNNSQAPVPLTEEQGFTPGVTLLHSGNTQAPAQPLRSLTSVEPPDKEFIEPPSSPVLEKRDPLAPSSSSLANPRSQNPSSTARKIPFRRSTALSDEGSSRSASPEIHKSPPHPSFSPPASAPKRDMLADRLRGAFHRKQPSETSVSSVNSDSSLPSVVRRESTNTITPTKTKPIPQKSYTTPAPKSTTRPIPMTSVSTSHVRQGGAANDDQQEDSPVDLADLLGGSVRLISVNGEDSEDSLPDPTHNQPMSRLPHIGDAPVVVQERKPPPSFRVTSRPSQDELRTSSGMSPSARPRSSTLITPPSPSMLTTTNNTAEGSHSPPPLGTGPASTTTKKSPSPTASPKNTHRYSKSFGNTREKRVSLSSMPPLPTTTTASTSMPGPPSKPFAARRDSPASSIGDSSSGRAPYTPKDGMSEAGGGSSASVDSSSRGNDSRWSGGASGLGVDGRGRPLKRRSMSVVEDLGSLLPYDSGKGKSGNTGPAAGGGGKDEKWVVVEKEEDAELRRKERRRGEAKAAIELGNVINGRGPIKDDDDDDDDEDLPINQALAARMNHPVMGLGTLPPPSMPMGFNGPSAPSGQASPWMMTPAPFMVPPPTDPALFAAHHQAMMHAKYAYQMAVAQQAMVAAGEEWERGSAFGGGGGGSVYGGGGGSAMSMYGGMPPSMGWSPGTLFPPAPASMYGGGIAQSDYGGGGGGRTGGGYSSSRSVFGENFGPSQRASRLFNPRESGYFPSTPSLGPAGNPRSRTTSSPAHPSRGVPSARGAPQTTGSAGGGGVAGRRVPPSSWKA